MKQGKSAQIKQIKNRKRKQKFNMQEKLPPFNYNDFAGFLRARFFLTHHNKYDEKTFEVASFFLDDLIAMMVNQSFSKFTSNEQAVVKMNEVMQATLVNSDDKDWRYFVLLVPVIYDIQQFIVKESSVNPRFITETSKFDINFWRMIMRTIMSINFFKWQNKDVSEMIKTSSAIDDLQFKFLLENEKDDDFNLKIIAETFKGLQPKLKPLVEVEGNIGNADINLTTDDINNELAYAELKLSQFKATSVKDVISENVLKMLFALHEGIAKEYNLTHREWTPIIINQFIMDHLLDYWTPEWHNLDGIGGEVKSYLLFLSEKNIISGFKSETNNIESIGRYIDVKAINYLLAQLTLDQVAELS
ncbi:metaphase chromosome protein 1 [Leuconostoc palmae]|uniref:metaphase chromosome protein 1 n=1 Tax=Leuconostoc palmae TaxID=501487 RepID=UPI001C7DA369|nr:metaphase chromosome protein 1 [Leuconostoc palmae]